ncbi:MAG: type II secretion system protein [Planctomycetota bacterium]|jgi:prepilin-type N-terminal cleavage/methylation domain-containing protein
MMRVAADDRRDSCAGFTLLELVVVMGILSGFLLMLVQMLGSGVSIFQEGERGLNLADRRAAATRALVSSIDAMIGPPLGQYDPQEPDLRMRLDWAPLGLDPAAGMDRTSVQVLRASVSLTEAQEFKLLRELLLVEAEEIAGGAGELAVEEKLSELVDRSPRVGRGEMLLFPWPVEIDGVFLELRRALFMPDDELELMSLVDFGGEDLPAEVLLPMTEVLIDGLLHFEILCWSQRSRNWESEPDAGGPEFVWDSARAGELMESELLRERFSLDLGPDSLLDPRDDVFPRWVRILMVLGDPQDEAAGTVLIEALSPTGDQAEIDRAENLSGEGPGMVKIGAEWVGYREIRGRRLLGLQRGMRGTQPLDHSLGSRVRSGLLVVVDRPLEHGRDAGDV